MKTKVPSPHLKSTKINYRVLYKLSFTFSSMAIYLMFLGICSF
jgi:hypothetical protein